MVVTRPPHLHLLVLAAALLALPIAPAQSAQPPAPSAPAAPARPAPPVVTDPDAAALQDAGIEPTADGIRAYLQQFIPDARQQQRLAELVARLGSDQFAERESATQAIGRLPVLPRADLEKAARSDDAEVATRARKLLDDAQPPQSVLPALRLVAKRNIEGLAAEVIAAGPYAVGFQQGRTLREAVAATARGRAADAPLLRRVLADAKAPGTARGAAAAGLAAALGDAFNPELPALLKHDEPWVRLAAARILLDGGNRAVLATLTELLAAPDEAVRWEAHEVLKAASGRQFAFDPAEDEDRRKPAADKWAAWARGDGQTADLRLPVQISDAQRLCNGVDLSGWRAVLNTGEDNGIKSWTVRDGVMRYDGQAGEGYLYYAKPFRDYELTVEWRWPEEGGDSGVWVLMDKPGGAGGAGGAQARCLEVQLLADSAGDFWLINGFTMQARGGVGAGHVEKLAASNEKPVGQWNRTTIRISKGTVTVKVNGTLQNEATGCPKTPGHIALQMENDPIEFRNVEVRALGD